MPIDNKFNFFEFKLFWVKNIKNPEAIINFILKIF